LSRLRRTGKKEGGKRKRRKGEGIGDLLLVDGRVTSVGEEKQSVFEVTSGFGRGGSPSNCGRKKRRKDQAGRERKVRAILKWSRTGRKEEGKKKKGTSRSYREIARSLGRKGKEGPRNKTHKGAPSNPFLFERAGGGERRNWYPCAYLPKKKGG